MSIRENKLSVVHAFNFILDLPSDIDFPEVGYEPAGRLGMEWASDYATIAIAFNEDGSITYAGYDSDGKIFHGTDFKTAKQLLLEMMCPQTEGE